MLPSTSSPAALSIEEPLSGAPSTSSSSPRTFRLLSLAFLALLAVVAVVVSLSVVLTRSAASGTVTVGRTVESEAWVLDTSSPSAASSAEPLTDVAASRADPADAHTFTWLFPQRNLDWLAAEFEARTTPGSSQFQQWHSFDTLMANIGPSAEAKAAVTSWLLSQGVAASAIADHGDAFQVDTTVGAVEAMFGTTMHYMRHVSLDQTATVSLSGQATVPAVLAPSLEGLRGVYDYPHGVYHLTTVRTPLTSRRAPVRAHVTGTAHSFHPMQTEETNKQCSSVSSYYPIAPPSLLVSAYNFTDRSTATGSSGTSVMATAFGGQAFSTNDLTHFQTNVGYSQAFNPAVYPSTTANTKNLNSYGIGDEANLDIQAIYQISPTSTNSFYASTSSESLLSAMQAITAMTTGQPQVVSISYGFGASDYNYYASDGGRTDTQFMMMGSLGITIVVAAGDDGTAGAYNRKCSTSPNKLGYGTITPLSSSPMLPTYPSSSPYVLSVGETDFFASATSSTQAYNSFSTAIKSPPECNNCPTDQRNIAYLCQATDLGEQPVSYGAKSDAESQTSGGGFSTVYSTPPWQTSAVSAYLKTECTSANGCTLPPASYYNASNRAYPDVAAFGGYFGIVYEGKETVVGGTSVAAPLIAGLIARLNEVNIAVNKAPLGFVNPLFYSIAAARPNPYFNDIKTGENACPQTNTACASHYQTGKGSTTCSGFYAAPGWDPVSGLGSLNVNNIISYLSPPSS